MTNPNPGIEAQSRAADLSDDQRRELLDELTARYPGPAALPAVNARLEELASYGRPSARQRVEHQLLAEKQLGLSIAARAMAGDSRVIDGVRDAATGMVAASTPPRRGDADGTGPARRVIEARHRDGSLPDFAAERCETLLNQGDAPARTLAAEYIQAAGSPAYARAFATWAADPTRGHMLWDREEQDAYKAVHRVRAAMSTGTGAGGEMVPLTLDPAIMLTSAGSNNPLRQISRVVQTVSNTWQGVSSAGATAEWKAEGAQAADASFAMAAKPIPVYTADVDVPFSYEVEMDAIGFVAELQRVMNDAVTQLTNTAYTTGGGSTLPKGYVPNATAPARTAGAFTTADVFLLQNSLPARFSGNASWLGNIAVSNAIAQFTTTNGSLMFPEIRESPTRLLTKPWYENSNQSGDMTTAASRFLAYGDFSQFVIVDRLGSTLEILPGYGANQRPSGQRHAFLYFRSGSDLVIPTAVQVIAKS